VNALARSLAVVLVVGCAGGGAREAGVAPVARGGGSQELDLVATAAFVEALETDSRAIFEALLDEHFRGTTCAFGPTEFPCQEQARNWLAILDCRDHPDTEQVQPTHAALAAQLRDALRARDRATLERFAACDFVTGPCNSDDVRTRLPGAAIEELLASAVAPDAFVAAEQGDTWADYAAEPGGRLRLQVVRKPEASGWVWSGYCWASAGER
jgi:hypothetical protein